MQHLTRNALTLLCAALPGILLADLKLDPLFQDNMVFCAGKPAFVSGKADAGEKVTVTLPSGSYSAQTDASGKFKVILPVFPVIKTPFNVTVQGKNTITLKNAVSGLVLLAGGQSNMEVPIKEALNPEQEAAAADYPLIREFKVKHDFAFEPVDYLKGKWTVVTPKTAPDIGAISFYCARMLQKELDGIPVGIINNSFSASPQQAWIPLEAVRKISPHRARSYDKYKHLGHDGLIAYREKLGKMLQVADDENKGEKQGWHKPDFDDSAWKNIKLPELLETVFGEKDGSYWFRRTVTVPEKFAGKDLEVELGVVDDYDVTYFNGEVVGKTGEETPNTWTVKRYYKIPGKLVKAGKNSLVVRCFDSGHAGGMFDKPMTLKCGTELVEDITGLWKTQVETMLEPKKWHPDYLPLIKCYHFASVLYNAMFCPLRGTPVNAILWYQGESNAGSHDFEPLFRECIHSWRKDLGDTEGNLPFLFVQLAAFTGEKSDPNDCGEWPVTRFDQAKVLDIPHTYMVPTIDIGDAKRIHPLNKQEVGRRLALHLLQSEFKSPKFADSIHYPEIAKATLSADGKQIVLALKAPEKLVLKEGTEPLAFAVAGPAEKVKHLMKTTWYPAKAELKNGVITVFVPEQIKDAKTLRYAWMMNPRINVFNELGFPMLPTQIELSR